jgi:hypothetical protein
MKNVKQKVIENSLKGIRINVREGLMENMELVVVLKREIYKKRSEEMQKFKSRSNL